MTRFQDLADQVQSELVSRLSQDSFHVLRRKWVSERKQLPDVDVAKAGGWRSISTWKRSYQLSDEAGVLEAIMEPRKLRDFKGKRREERCMKPTDKHLQALRACWWISTLRAAMK